MYEYDRRNYSLSADEVGLVLAHGARLDEQAELAQRLTMIADLARDGGFSGMLALSGVKTVEVKGPEVLIHKNTVRHLLDLVQKHATDALSPVDDAALSSSDETASSEILIREMRSVVDRASPTAELPVVD